MTDIEKAIRSMQNLNMVLSITDSERNAVDLAIQALQEKAEREKGCEYCTGDVDERPILIKSGGEYVYIDGNGKLTLNDLNGLQLNLCPMCGRKLGE